MASKRPKSRTEDLVIQEANGEKLIYDLRTNKALCLNETSALVWEACNGSRDVSEIGGYVSQKLDSEANDDLIWLALDQLRRADLITSDTAVENRFEGISRREVIRKIGLGSMVALPIVASIVAPTALHAQTCLPAGTVAGGTINSGTNCGGPAQGTRDAACTAQRGNLCCSGTATATACAAAGASVTCTCA